MKLLLTIKAIALPLFCASLLSGCTSQRLVSAEPMAIYSVHVLLPQGTQDDAYAVLSALGSVDTDHLHVLERHPNQAIVLDIEVTGAQELALVRSRLAGGYLPLLEVQVERIDL